jgi:anthranilate phosphoribosyltransferase
LPTEALHDALRALAHGRPLSAPEVREAFGVIMRGESTPAQTAGILMALRARGETPEELAGAAQALRDAMTALPNPAPDSLVDTCGTGGGTLTTFNISTGAAFVAAAAGVRVAKHGNRSYTSRCGSADVLEALGVPLEASLDTMSSVLAESGIVFMFAPRMHPAMRHVVPVRRELGIPTIMNLVGPLANPAGATRQVIGVGDPDRLSVVAGAALALGCARALVVHGAPGLDEISPLGATRVLEVRDSAVRDWTIDPAEHDLAGPASHLACGDPQDNALIIREVLSGRGPKGARAAVALNAAAAIYVAGLADSYADSVSRAVATLDSGAGLTALDRMLAAYRSHESP